MSYINGLTIQKLRKEKNLTQKQLAQMLLVSDKTVSKWETNRGLPDITILPELASALGVSVAELMTGEIIKNENRRANMKKSVFYVCPVCGNVLFSIGEGAFSCCSVSLIPLEAEEQDAEIKSLTDQKSNSTSDGIEHEAQHIQIETCDDEYYITVKHEMTKTHFIPFIAYVTDDSIQFKKLYPEQNAECNFKRCGHGIIYAYCNRHGLLYKKV
ncbi:MAG: helix-turn-helix domain-containing protein [Acutalibacteraceae bacterium]